MNQSAELRRRAEALAGELADIREEIHRIEQERYVQVKFIGNPKIYTYEMAPGHEAKIDDYVCVFSPMTRRDELVKVVGTGRGSTLLGRSPKLARQVSIVIRVTNNVNGELITDEAYDPFRGADC